MRKLLVLFAIGVAALLTTLPARADFVDGETLMQWADEYRRIREGTADTLSHVYVRRFQVYVMGVHDAHVGIFYPTSGELMFCGPRNLSVAQASEVVFRFLQRNPERRRDAGSVLVMSAFVETFPCEK
ncbi:MAG: hypothetical protein JSU95_14120 [Betaproteobacteria bacterium]|nr:MAG: hypothetical protein JSU95_14120 [Betaproteobacteria bacterium]